MSANTHLILIIGRIWLSDQSYWVQFAHSTPSDLTGLPSGALFSAGETGAREQGADTAVFPHCRCSTHHSNLKQLMTRINYSSSRQGDVTSAYCMFIALTTHKLCSRIFGLAALSLSDTVLGRHVSLVLRGCMALISVNTVLRLLKRTTCVRGRTHSSCRYLPVWGGPQSRGATNCLKTYAFLMYNV